MKIGFIGDLHIGAREGNDSVREFIFDYLCDYALPLLKSKGVTTIFQAGDFMDSRKKISGMDINAIRRRLRPILEYLEMEVVALTGNHDISLDESNDVNWGDILSEIIAGFVNVSRPRVLKMGSAEFLMIPWINKENYEEVCRTIDSTSAEYLMGHLDLSGFPMYAGLIQTGEGQIPVAKLTKFKKVFSGHFHCRSKVGNVEYLGTPYHLNWKDHEDGTNRGIYIFDTETGDVEFIRNSEDQTMFKIFEYSDDMPEEVSAKTQTVEGIEELMGGKIVKVVVKSRSDERKYQNFMQVLRKANVIDYNFIDRTVFAVASKDAVSVEELATEIDDGTISEEALHADVLDVMSQRIDRAQGIEADRTKKHLLDVYETAQSIKSGRIL